MVIKWRTAGFSLIEILVAMVVMAIAMVGLAAFLYPQIQDSARPHYEVRATALAQSLMTEIISRNYDHNSDSDGGIKRCDEAGATACSTTIGPDAGSSDFDASGKLQPQNFNDVDDYVGCWFTNTASKSFCTSSTQRSLTDVLGGDISNQYPNFVANITVVLVSIDGKKQFKKVTVAVTAGSYGTYSIIAHRGNF